MDSLITSLQSSSSSPHLSLSSLSSLESFVVESVRRGCTDISSLTTNSVKLFVVIGSLLESVQPYPETGQDDDDGDDNGGRQVSTDDDALSSGEIVAGCCGLLRSLLSLLGTSSSMLLSLLLPSLLPHLLPLNVCVSDFLRSIPVECGEGTLQGVLEDLCDIGMESDDWRVRKETLKLADKMRTYIKGNPEQTTNQRSNYNDGRDGGNNEPPSSYSQRTLPPLYLKFLESLIARSRDMHDSVVRSSLVVLRSMARDDSASFRDAVEELGGVHRELVNYYQADIFPDQDQDEEGQDSHAQFDASTSYDPLIDDGNERGRSSSLSYADVVQLTPSGGEAGTNDRPNGRSNDDRQRPSKPTKVSDDLTFGFVPPSLIRVLQGKSEKGGQYNKESALSTIGRLFDGLTDDSLKEVLHFLPLFLDLTLQMTGPGCEGSIRKEALKVIEKVGIRTPITLQESKDIAAPFLIKAMEEDDDDRGSGDASEVAYRIFYRIIRSEPGSGSLLHHLTCIPSTFTSDVNIPLSSPPPSPPAPMSTQAAVKLTNLTVVSLLLTEHGEMDFDVQDVMKFLCDRLSSRGNNGRDSDADADANADADADKVKIMALEGIACLQRVLGQGIQVVVVLKNMGLLQGDEMIEGMVRRRIGTGQTLNLPRLDGEPTFGSNGGVVVEFNYRNFFDELGDDGTTPSSASAGVEPSETFANPMGMWKRPPKITISPPPGDMSSDSDVEYASTQHQDNNKTPTRSNVSPPKFSRNDSDEYAAPYDNGNMHAYGGYNYGEFDSDTGSTDRQLMRIQSFGEMPSTLSHAVDKSFKGMVPLQDDSSDEELSSAVIRDNNRRRDLQQADQKTPSKSNSSYEQIPDWQRDVIMSNEKNSMHKNSMQGVVEGGNDGRSQVSPPSSTGRTKGRRSSKYETPTKPPPRSTYSSEEDELFTTEHTEQMLLIKKRQASRSAARRALSANNADERKSRPKRTQGDPTRHHDALSHGPSTPVAVGKYKSDGTRQNVHTTTEVQMKPLARRGKEIRGEERPIKPMKGLPEMDPDAEGAMEGVYLDSNGGGIAVGVISGGGEGNRRQLPSNRQTVSLATKRRMQRQRKKEDDDGGGFGDENAALRKHPHEDILRSQSNMVSSSGQNGNDPNFSGPRTPRRRAQTEVEKNTISFSGNEHVSSSLRAENHDYLSTDDIRPSPNPQVEMQRMMGGIGTDEWPEIFHTLNSVRRLSIHHGNLIEGHLHTVVRSVIKAADNLRSAVSKNAILTLQDMWIGLKRAMDPELAAVTPMLLKRFADTNGFLSEVADAAIISIIENGSPMRALTAFLNSAGNKLPNVRAKAAATVLKCVIKLEGGLTNSRELEKLLGALPQFCQDKQSDTRGYGRQIASLLVMKDIVSEARMQRVLPPDVWVRVEQGMRTGNVIFTPTKRKGKGAKAIMASSPTNVGGTLGGGGGGGGIGGGGGGIGAGRVGTAGGESEDFEISGKRASGGSGGIVLERDFELLPDIYKGMRSNDWKERQTSVMKVVELVLKHSHKMCTSGKIVQVFDRLSERLADGNQKVNAYTLESVERLVIVFGNKLEPVLNVFLPALVGNLARTPKIVALAKNCLETLMNSIEPKILCGHLASLAESNSIRIKTAMIVKLSEIVGTINETKPNLIGKHIYPTAFKLIGENKPEIKSAVNRLLVALHETVGGAILDAGSAAGLRQGEMDKLSRICGIY